MLKKFNRFFGENVILFVLLESLLFAFLLLFVHVYKLFSLCCTSILISLVTYIIAKYLIGLTNLDIIQNQSNEQNNEINFKRKMANFLFRNEYFYNFAKSLFNKRSFIVELKTFLTSASSPDIYWSQEAYFNDINNNLTDEIDEWNKLNKEVEKFLQKFSIQFIETWYCRYVSKNDQFINESRLQLHYLFNDLLKRFRNTHKLTLFANALYVFNDNFINIAIGYKKFDEKLPIEQLHPAIRNSPTSEIIYVKRIIQIILRKSANNFNINQQLLEELFMQIIGKNCLETLITITTKPNFLFYVICLLISKKKTYEALFNNNYEQDTAHKEDHNSIVTENLTGSLNDSNDTDLDSMTNSLIESESQHNLVSNFNDADENKRTLSETIASEYNMINPNDYNINSLLNIFNLKIVGTETSHEDKSGKSYTVYIIEFEYNIFNNGLKEDKGLQLESTSLNSKSVKRRFKEFVLLQKSLDEHLIFKPFLKSIKGPSKFVNLPIGNMEEELIEKRRRRLNQYLNELIQIPQIRNCKEIITFLNLNEQFPLIDKFSAGFASENEKNLKKSISGVFEKRISMTKSSSNLNSHKHDDSTSESIHEILYEYSYQDGFQKIQTKLSQSLLNIKPTKDIIKENESNTPVEASKQSANIFSSNKKFKNNINNAHFSKILLEILNKSLVASSIINNIPKKIWLNNQHVYKMIETFICDYYAERFFEDFFENILSTNKLVDYIRDIEYILFDRPKNSGLNFDTDEKIFYDLANKLINEFVPNLVKNAFGSKRFTCMIELLLDSLNTPILNKHYMYSLIDLIIYFIYNEEYD